MTTVTPFQFGEQLVFLGGPRMLGKPGARVLVTRAMYVSAGGSHLVDVMWIDKLGIDMRRGSYPAALFRRDAKIIAMPFRAGAARRLLLRVPGAVLFDTPVEESLEAFGKGVLKVGKPRVFEGDAVPARCTLAWEQLDLDFMPAAETSVSVTHAASKIEEAPPAKGAQ